MILNDRQTREILQRSRTEKYRNKCKMISFGILLNTDCERAPRVSFNDHECNQNISGITNSSFSDLKKIVSVNPPYILKCQCLFCCQGI
jgi:hypothetical protein